MVMTNCKECGKEASDSAKQCPHCGSSKNDMIRYIFLLFNILLILVLGCDNNGKNKLSNSVEANMYNERIQKSIASDERNSTVEVYVSIVDNENLRISINELFDGATRLDVFRILLQVAEELQTEKFAKVFLSNNSVDRFFIKGDYFEKIGSEYSWQNPNYTIRTFPENVYLLNGNRAYSRVQDGSLVILTKQSENFNDVIEKWALN